MAGLWRSSSVLETDRQPLAGLKSTTPCFKPQPQRKEIRKMNRKRSLIWFVSLVGLVVLLSTANQVNAQKYPRGFLSKENRRDSAHSPMQPHNQNMDFRCQGEVMRVEDVAFEGVKTTTANWGASPGGGDGGRFDKTPILTTKVTLDERSCLDAHLSAIVGSRQSYGPAVSRMTMFQVTLTPSSGGALQHMIGHYDFPYGQYGPAVALSAEYDVDMYASNFFQRVGKERGDVPPGTYQVDVWWAGGPVGGGGAIGADFVLKLYLRK
jgi:hypothetical protein